jgi:hypothetical protein
MSSSRVARDTLERRGDHDASATGVQNRSDVNRMLMRSSHQDRGTTQYPRGHDTAFRGLLLGSFLMPSALSLDRHISICYARQLLKVAQLISRSSSLGCFGKGEPLRARETNRAVSLYDDGLVFLCAGWWRRVSVPLPAGVLVPDPVVTHHPHYSPRANHRGESAKRTAARLLHEEAEQRFVAAAALQVRPASGVL